MNCKIHFGTVSGEILEELFQQIIDFLKESVDKIGRINLCILLVMFEMRTKMSYAGQNSYINERSERINVYFLFTQNPLDHLSGEGLF